MSSVIPEALAAARFKSERGRENAKNAVKENNRAYPGWGWKRTSPEQQEYGLTPASRKDLRRNSVKWDRSERKSLTVELGAIEEGVKVIVRRMCI